MQDHSHLYTTVIDVLAILFLLDPPGASCLPPLVDSPSYTQLYRMYRYGRSEPHTFRRSLAPQPPHRPRQAALSDQDLATLLALRDLTDTTRYPGDQPRYRALTDRNRYPEEEAPRRYRVAHTRNKAYKGTLFSKRNSLARELQAIRDIIKRRRRMCWGCHGRRGRRSLRWAALQRLLAPSGA